MPDLGVNLVSVQTLTAKGLECSISGPEMLFYRNGKLLIRADQRGRFWCLSDFTRRTDETALIAGLDNRTQGTIGDAALVGEAESDMEETSEYNLWHRRLGHFGKTKLRNQHTITDGLRKRIAPGSGEDKCDVRLETKMRRENFGPSALKTELLELVSMDVCGPFGKSINGNQYFLQIVDYASRKGWVIPIPDRRSTR